MAMQLQKFIDSCNDDIANQTSWKPLIDGSASFRTSAYVKLSSSHVEFRPSLAHWGFMTFCFLFSLGCLYVAGSFFWHQEEMFLFPAVVLSLMGVLFLVGAIAQWNKTKTRVFDLDLGWFWEGKRNDTVEELESRSTSTPLNLIHALQLIEEQVQNGDKVHDSYELNLVLKDGSRLDVADHGHLKSMQTDAERLGKFLNVPLWAFV